MNTRTLNNMMRCGHLTTYILKVYVIKAIEWFGTAFGIVGALMLAANTWYSGYGWVAFLLSNVCWIIFALIKKINGMFVMQLVFMGTSVLGIVRWLA